jgi:K+-transporting ATPase c subunit
MRRQLIPSILSMVLFTVLLGGVYSLVVTGVAQLAFKDKADGSIVERLRRQGRQRDSEVLPIPTVCRGGCRCQHHGRLRPHAQ